MVSTLLRDIAFLSFPQSEVRVPGEEDPTERPLEVRELDLGLRAAGLAKEPLQAVDRALRAARMRRPKLLH